MIAPSTLEAAANVATAAAEALAGASPSPFARGAALAGAPAEAAAHFAAAGGAGALAKAARPRTAKTAARKASGAGYAAAKSASSSNARASGTATSKSSSSAAKTTGALSFLGDPKLSIEEKLFRLMAYLQDKYEKELDKKFKEMAGGDGSRTSTSSASKASASETKSSSFLSAVVEGVKTALPAAGIALDALKNPTMRGFVKQIGGPLRAAAATVLGFPELAPALLKYGPQVVDLAAGAVASLDEGKPKTSGASASASSGNASSTSTVSASSAGDGKSEQVQMMELQRLVNQQNEMFSMISNVMKSWHDTRSAIIANLR